MRKLLPRLLAATAFVAGALLVPSAASAAPSSNDDFANATVISSLPFSDTVDVTDATSQAGEPNCTSPPDSRSAWYDFTPASDQTVRLTATGQSSTTLAVYTGSDVSSLSNVTGCSYFGQPVFLNANAGMTYHIRMAAFPFDPGGSLTLNVNEIPAPPNDAVANAISVGPLPFSDTEDLTAATTEPGEPSASCFGTSNTEWYAFTPDKTGSITATTDQFGPGIDAYTGSSLSNLSQVGCNSFRPLTFSAQAGTTYYFQVQASSQVTFRLDVAPNPVAQFFYSPGDPSVFDTVQFFDNSSDPGGNNFSSEVWHYGDGTTATNPGCCAAHQYKADGDYTIELDVTTTDGRTASTQQVVHVRTHDVSIAKVLVPQVASVGQTRTITVGITDSRYPETVQVQLSKSVAGGGWQQVGVLTQYVPVRGANRTTNFNFSYTFAPEDASLGKVNFQAVATIQGGARDAIPSDNSFTSLATKVVR
jgi:PKD domain